MQIEVRWFVSGDILDSITGEVDLELNRRGAPGSGWGRRGWRRAVLLHRVERGKRSGRRRGWRRGIDDPGRLAVGKRRKRSIVHVEVDRVIKFHPVAYFGCLVGMPEKDHVVGVRIVTGLMCQDHRTFTPIAVGCDPCARPHVIFQIHILVMLKITVPLQQPETLRIFIVKLVNLELGCLSRSAEMQ